MSCTFCFKIGLSIAIIFPFVDICMMFNALYPHSKPPLLSFLAARMKAHRQVRSATCNCNTLPRQCCAHE
jgi:hypothetical protein